MGSLPSGFHFEEFIGLKIENVVISYCRLGSRNAAIELVNGSEVIIDHVFISNSSVYGYTGLVAEDVVGSFSILNSNYLAKNGVFIFVNYSHCELDVPTILTFTNSSMILNSNHNCESGTCNNLVIGCSNVHIVITDTVILCGLCIFFNTSISNNSVVMSNFSGSVSVHNNENHLQFGSTCAKSQHPALCFENGAGNTVLVENSFIFIFARVYGESTQMTLRNVTFSQGSGSPISVGAKVTFLDTTAILVDCTFENNIMLIAILIQAVESTLIFQGTNLFKSNSGESGAGIRLLDSYITLLPYTHILFENNHAVKEGGAIYSFTLRDKCFFNAVSPEFRDTVRVSFIGNAAGGPGTSLYGVIDKCCDLPKCNNFFSIFNISNTETHPSAIASETKRVCVCEDGNKQPNCSPYGYDVLSIHAYPGEKFSLHLALTGTGPFFGAVPGIIDAGIFDPGTALEPSQYFQTSDSSSCNVFTYSVLSSMVDRTVQVMLTVHGRPDFPVIFVGVNLMECPLGFPLSPTLGKCQCDSAAYHYNVECHINNHSFWRSANSRTWIGFVDESSNASSKPGVMYHANCPIGHCSSHDVNITSNSSDDQCEPHRTGLLCGECEVGYSLTLGNGNCEKCSNTYLLLLLPFAVAGLLLVVVLFALNLTVAEGSINGLIFYICQRHEYEQCSTVNRRW